MSKYTGYQELRRLVEANTLAQSTDPDPKVPPQEDTEPKAPQVEDCICGGGQDYEYGHLNQAGGYCCPHKGNTCGFSHSPYN